MTDTTTRNTDTDSDTTTVHVFRTYIKATPEAIWEAITSPEWNGRYGYHTIQNYDLRPGGAYTADATAEMREYGGVPDIVVDGEVIECDPPRKLVQTWKMHFSPEMEAEPYTTLTFEIEPEGETLTRLTVTHDVTGAPVHEAQTTPNPLKVLEGGGGWAWILADLKSLLENGESLEP